MGSGLELTGSDGRPHRAWLNPGTLRPGKFERARGFGGMRGMHLRHDLWIWPCPILPHAGFTGQTGICGIRLVIGERTVDANLEAVAQPELVPWAFGGSDPAEMDNEARSVAIEAFLRASPRLAALLPDGFALRWYL